MSATKVNIKNFERAETDRMFQALCSAAGGVGRWKHHRDAGSIDEQPVIRQNRDTLYSSALVDISDGATLTVPDAGERYISVMAVNQDHYINRVYHEGGAYQLSVDEFDTPYVLVVSRILVDPEDSADVAKVNALQDELKLTASSNAPFDMPEYDSASFVATRDALLELSRGVDKFTHAFGKQEDVDPVLHLLGTASGWGGLPDTEASYLNVDPGFPVGEYKVEIGDVPVDAFWSISVYNAKGYFEANDRNKYSVTSVTAERNPDGTVTVNFGVSDDDKPNYLPIMEGWNYAVRLYQPRQEILDGTWVFPSAQPV